MHCQKVAQSAVHLHTEYDVCDSFVPIKSKNQFMSMKYKVTPSEILKHLQVFILYCIIIYTITRTFQRYDINNIEAKMI